MCSFGMQRIRMDLSCVFRLKFGPNLLRPSRKVISTTHFDRPAADEGSGQAGALTASRRAAQSPPRGQSSGEVLVANPAVNARHSICENFKIGPFGSLESRMSTLSPTTATSTHPLLSHG